jgi:eukaryotic-like serine/threonine-protein kinase
MKSFDCPHCHKVFESEPTESEVVLCPHCNSTVALPEKDLAPGSLMGGFEIIRLLGRGGMGNVYLAKQLSMQRLVALKILLKSLTKDKESLKQFLNEARVSGRLSHPNIIPAIDAGEYQNNYYLATAFVDGEDLERKLEKEHTLSEKEALSIVIKIAHALNYAWEAYGLLHKDIKPGNIMYDVKGEVFLMDMGIAQYIGESSGGEDHILGSPFYMSPEQTTASRLSWTSDLYSLGATLYNMLVGVPPYDAPDVMRIIEMHTTEPFPAPETKNPAVHISKPTVDLMKAMMGKKPQDRHDSWLGFIEAAGKALKQLETPASGKKAPLSKKSSAKKSPSVRKKGKKGNIVPKRTESKKTNAITQIKKHDPVMAIISWILLLIVAGGVAFIILDYHKKNIAHESVSKAERFAVDHIGEYDSIIDQFLQAKQKCKGTDLEDKVNKRLVKFRKEKKVQQKLIANYKEARIRVDVLFANKNYDKALKTIISASRNIQDPSIQRDADMTILLIKEGIKENIR